MRYTIVCFWFAVSCTPSKDFDVSDFDNRLTFLKESIQIDANEDVLADTILSLESLIRREIEYLDENELPTILYIDLTGNFLKDHYKESNFPFRLSSILNFVDSTLLARFPAYPSSQNQFSPRSAFETSGIPFEREFFIETKLDVDMQQKFLFGLLRAVKKAEKEFYLYLKSKSTLNESKK